MSEEKRGRSAGWTAAGSGVSDDETSRSDCCGEIKEQREKVKEDRLGRSREGQDEIREKIPRDEEVNEATWLR